VAFPASQLRILPYNRLVADLNGLTAGQFLEQVKARFTVTAAADRAAVCFFMRDPFE